MNENRHTHSSVLEEEIAVLKARDLEDEVIVVILANKYNESRKRIWFYLRKAGR